MDDIDDVLGDLLAETDSKNVRKSQTTSAKFGKKTTAKAEDDFYSSLAADAGDSDVSDADPAQMADSLDDLDAMDSALFGGGGKKPGSAARASTPKLTAQKTPPSKDKPGPAKPSPSISKPVKRASYGGDFDEDDPLAGLLSDEDSARTPRKSPKAKQPALSEGDTSHASRRLEIERPPTRSGSNREEPEEKPISAPPGGSEKKPKVDDLFEDDDDDPLGGMGLDSPRKTRAPVQADDLNQSGKSSILDDLLGTGNSSLLQKSGSAQKREFVLDAKYTKKQQASAETEEDFTFGSYMPSAAGGGGTGSRPNSRRSVRFENDGEPRASSAGAGGRRKVEGQKEDPDPLGLKDERPRSADVLDKPQSILKPNNSEPASDWLGLSRLGSPESPRPPPASTATSKHQRDKEENRSQQTIAQNNGDWLGIGNSSKDTTEDDWLGLGNSGSKPDDWLGLSGSKRSQPESKRDRRGSSDLLGSTEFKKESAADYLGLGAEIHPDPLRESQLDGTLDGKRSKPLSADLFSTPASRDPSSSLPWEKPTKQSPSESDTLTTPRSNKLSPRGTLADSPRSMAAQLHQLQMLESVKEDNVKTASNVAKPKILSDAPLVQQMNTSPTSPAKVLPISTVPSAGSAGSNILDMLESEIPTAVSPQSPLKKHFHQQQLDASLYRLQETKKQENMLSQYQNSVIQQQQLQQVELQLAAQEAELKQQQQQQLAALQQAQHQLLQSKEAQIRQPMTMLGATGPLFGIGETSSFLQSKIQQLEMEKDHLQSLMQTSKLQHQEQLKLMETSYQDRMDLMEETYKRRESRLRDENDLLLTHSESKIKLLQQEKEHVLSSQFTKLEQWERDKLQEMDRMKEIHKHSINELRKEHEETLQRLRKLKDQEIDTVANAQVHTKSMQAVMDQVTLNARELGEIQHKVDQKHSVVLDERELAVKARDEQLRSLKERMERQSAEMERERARLQGLISKLESQLTEQNRHLDEDKWKLQQEETRLQTMQASLTRERQQMVEQSKREQQDLKASKKEILEEQKNVLEQLYQERRALAEERTQFNISLKLQSQAYLRQSMDSKKSEAEIDGSLRMIGEERTKLSVEMAELHRQQQELVKQRAQLDQQSQMFQTEKNKLEHVAIQLKQRSVEIDEMCTQATQMKKEGMSALTTAKKHEAEQVNKIDSIQTQITTLRAKERQIAQERLALAKEKQSLQNLKNRQICANCRTPVKDTPDLPRMLPGTQVAQTAQQVGVMTPAAAQLMSTLSPYLHSQPSSLQGVAASIQVDRSVRLMKIHADKDRDYLEEESYFLEALKHSPYHGLQPSTTE